jgi:hypothetical protein
MIDSAVSIVILTLVAISQSSAQYVSDPGQTDGK